MDNADQKPPVKTYCGGKPNYCTPEQEPVAWADMDVRGEDKGLSWTPGHFHKTPLYTGPQPAPTIEKSAAIRIATALGYVPLSDTSPERVDKEAKLRQEQEPTVKHMMEWVEYLKRQSDHGQHLHIPSGMSAGTCWELAIELEQFVSTAPQRREWVGLTDAELAEFSEAKLGAYDLCLEVEAKLREKNNA